ncbi:hypothetical protein OEZ85_002009 [Tetradesmus obliquus]|uniref:PUB domain-containing protein n=1 Tax=Tetradesmus obliquus TaxID=3088 RepID=A0ABY8U1U5_TETOB|nr:hypothetical protein OEZ85_002009 [Tetradesmus obliquus]
MATPNRIMTGSSPQEVQMTRLSKSLLDQLGVRLEHSELKKLGYRAEKRPNNPNTYYKVPGLHANIENCPKVVKYIKQACLQNKKQELEKLLGKGVTPKLPPANPSRGAAAADAAPGDQGSDDDSSDDDEAEASDEDEEMEEVQEAPATVDGKGNKAPAGFVFISGDKQDKVLEGLASYIAAQAPLRNITAAQLLAKGLRAVEESRPLAPGERMRHAFVWWPGRTPEPLRCAQYIFAAKNLLEIKEARQALGLPPLAAGKPGSGGSSSAAAAAKKRPSSAASEGVLTPPPLSSAAAAAKRTRTSTGEGVAAAKLGAGNQQVLNSVDDAVKLLGEALALARSLPPAVLNSLPSVFTAGLDGTLQEFLAAAVAMQEGLTADKELLLRMAADYAAELAAGGTAGGLVNSAAAAGSSSSRGRSGAAAAAAAESHYRRPYLAFRAALASCASDAHSWLQDKQQREMIARLEGLCQIKQQLQDKKSQEEQMRQEQEAMRQQKEKLEQELKAYKEKLQHMEEEQRRKSASAVATAAAEATAAAAQQQQAGRGDAAGTQQAP